MLLKILPGWKNKLPTRRQSEAINTAIGNFKAGQIVAEKAYSMYLLPDMESIPDEKLHTSTEAKGFKRVGDGKKQRNRQPQLT